MIFFKQAFAWYYYCIYRVKRTTELKTFIRLSILPGIGIILLVLAWSISNFLYRTDTYRVPGNEVQLVLNAKQKQMENLLKSVALSMAITENASMLDFNKLKNNPLSKVEELEQSGFSVFVYKNNRLSLWSNNMVPIPEFLDKSFDAKLYKNTSGFYVVEKLVQEQYTIIGLILIKTNYKYENKYLHNSFQAHFNLPDFVRVIQFNLSYSHQINDRQGNYVFSLVPESTMRLQLGKQNLTAALFIIGFILLFTGLNFSRRKLTKATFSRIVSAILITTIIALRVIMIQYKQPAWLYELAVFSTDLFAVNYWFNSLGDLILNSYTILFVVVCIFGHSNLTPFIEYINKKRSVFKIVTALAAIAAILLSSYVLQIALNSLMLDSDLNFKIYLADELTVASLFGIAALTLIIIAYLITVQRLIFLIKNIVSNKVIVRMLLFLYLPAVLLLYVSEFLPDKFTCAFIILLVLTQLYFEPTRHSFSFYRFTLLGVLLSAFLALYIANKQTIKEEAVLKVKITKWLADRDPYIEHRFNETVAMIPTDPELQALCGTPDSVGNFEVQKYITETYFTAFWTKFNVTASFVNADSTNIENPALNNNFIAIDSSFYFKDNFDGSFTYTKFINIEACTQRLFVSLQSTSNLNNEGLQAQLFSITDFIERPFAKNLSFAKYTNHNLVKKSGVYPYRLSDLNYTKNNELQYFLVENGFKHLVYRTDSNTTLILSSETDSVWNIVTSLAYFLVYYNVLLLIYYAIKRLPTLVRNFRFNFKSKIIFLMFSVLVLSFVLVGIGTAWFEVLKYNNKLQNEYTEKTNSICTDLKNFDVFKFESDSVIFDQKELNKYLLNLSEVFATEINIYSKEGRLIAGSDLDMFDKGLKNKFLHPAAHIALANVGLSKYSHNEQIGNLNYISIYAPLTNNENRVLAYINLPYFTKSESIRNEISAMLVAIINLYVFLFLISLFVSLFISDKITHPLLILESKFRNVQLGKSYDEIQYTGNDEIGNLVKVYNRLVGELNESVELLARSEREMAWREMAKQIAHEIKNPLTPMKINVQYLQKAWNEKNPNFEPIFLNTTQSVIEQADTLSNIATEFSNFAKMPRANNEVINLVPILDSIVRMFVNTEKTQLSINFNKLEEALIYADKEHIERVFINLIKNGMQAIPNGKEGIVKVDLFANSKIVRVKIEDNGTGISEELKDKLFRPNFTTKNSGMGMGLAIVKNIIENASGVIWFETELGKGTRFFVEFPVNKLPKA